MSFVLTGSELNIDAGIESSRTRQREVSTVVSREQLPSIEVERRYAMTGDTKERKLVHEQETEALLNLRSLKKGERLYSCMTA